MTIRIWIPRAQVPASQTQPTWSRASQSQMSASQLIWMAAWFGVALPLRQRGSGEAVAEKEVQEGVGVPPAGSQSGGVPAAAAAAPSPAVNGDAVQCDYNSRLPNGSSVQPNVTSSIGRVCGLSITYCCSPEEGGGGAARIPTPGPPPGTGAGAGAGTPSRPCVPPACLLPPSVPRPLGAVPDRSPGALSAGAIGSIVGGVLAVLLGAAIGLAMLRAWLLREGVSRWLPIHQWHKPSSPSRQSQKSRVVQESDGLLRFPAVGGPGSTRTGALTAITSLPASPLDWSWPTAGGAWQAGRPPVCPVQGQLVGGAMRVHSMPLRGPDLLSEWPTSSSTLGGGGVEVGLRRVATWHGVLRQVAEAQAPSRPAPHQQAPLRKAVSSFQELGRLPPLQPLAPLLTLSSMPPHPLHLDVNFDSEIRPFLGRCLGTGGFGSVYEATWRGRPVAVKMLPNMGNGELEAFNALVREVDLSSKFDSNRLVKVYGACLKDPSSACIVMELLKENLHQRIYDRSRPRMKPLEVLQVAHDIAEGLAYLHPSVIHRDLKPSNILLDTTGRAKLADFGISRIKDPSKTYLTTTNDNGTPMYMAPEQFNGGHVDEKVDVYSWACIVNECLTRRPPWEDLNFFQIIVAVAIRGQRPALDIAAPDAVRRMISRCWAPDPRFRPSTPEILRLTELWIQQAARGLLKWSNTD
eukprot:jgi/Botrbrau1/37/Bobra.0022s0032.1